MAPVRVVLFGLPASHPSIPEAIRPKVVEQLDALHAEFTEAGMDYEFFEVSPDADLAAVGPKLEAFRPDCIIVGNGVRSNMGLTSFMEKLIDLARTSAPQAKLAFNTMPDTTIAAARRWFPSADK